jgi:hypothetical protein
MLLSDIFTEHLVLVDTELEDFMVTMNEIAGFLCFIMLTITGIYELNWHLVPLVRHCIWRETQMFLSGAFALTLFGMLIGYVVQSKALGLWVIIYISTIIILGFLWNLARIRPYQKIYIPPKIRRNG